MSGGDMTQYDPPASLTDMDAIPHARDAWHLTVSTWFRQGVARASRWVGHGHSQFFDYLANPPAGQLTEAEINWNGFPKSVYVGHTHEEALQAAETLVHFSDAGRTVAVRPQDEYLEWHATADAQGRIVAVDFTCEGPEYWMSLAHGYPASVRPGHNAPPAHGDLDVVVQLYQQHVSPDVQRDDLLLNGRYDPYNVWNTERGAMHLTHPSNALQAEVFLAADASVLREENGQVIEDDDELIACAQYGVSTRASDPTIGGQVNALARQGALVSLLNPVGLYIAGLDDTGWTKPDGNPVGTYWSVVRGTDAAIVRARYAVPPEEGFTVSDVKIGGVSIEHGGQIAEHVTMKLTGVAAELGQHHVTAAACVTRGLAPPSPVAEQLDGAASVASVQTRHIGA
jgi:hypothetical protein